MSNKKVYQEKVEAQLEQLQADIKKLKAQAKETKADAKIEYQQQVSDLIAKQKAAEQKLQQLRQATTESWEELKNGTDKAVNALQQSFSRIKQTMKNSNEKVYS
jgi:hypothetical protein